MRIILSLALCFIQATAVLADIAQDTRALAEQGNALAQAKLASLYLLGREGVEQDEKQAALWMEKAAIQGVVDAELVMAAMYDKGLGVLADREKSTRWYEKAAAKGNTTALAILGKNDVAKGSVQFNYQAMRLSASKSIPTEYAKKFLLSK